MEKHLIDRRMRQMEAEGVAFRTNVEVGVTVSMDMLLADYDAVVLSGGAEAPRDLPVAGRELDGIHFAMDFLVQQNKRVAGDPESKAAPNGTLSAKGKHVVVIGGGDTGSDCVGTSNRHGAASVTQFEIMPQPPAKENKMLVWPDWPLKLRTSSSHQEEGCERDWSVQTQARHRRERQDHGAGMRAGGLAAGRWRPDEAGGSAGQRIHPQGRPGAAGDGLCRPEQGRAGGTVRRGAGCARQCEGAADQLPDQQGRRFSPAATCAAASRWWCGRSAKGANAPAASTSS